MKYTMTAENFADEMAENYSRDGARALFEFLEDNWPDLEFDRVAIRSEWTEYDSALDAAEELLGWNRPHVMGNPEDIIDREEGINEAALVDLQDRATVIQFDGGVIVSSF